MPSEANKPGSAPVLDIHQLRVAYGGRTVVDEVSFRIQRGEIFGLLGPNGAGKTSTLSAIEGLVTPTSGTLLVDGIDVQQQPLAVKALLGVQLQSSSFQAELNIQEITKLYAGLYGVKFSPEQVRESLRTVGLADGLGKKFKQLSGGQQQRLALFIATVHNPLLLLLDEPTAGLDPNHAADYGDASRSSARKATASCSLPTRWRRPRQSVTGWRSSTTENCSPREDRRS
ncbi:ABC transporter ATP-binding protein [Micrococcaceae bacterium Sec5.1]